MYHWALVYYPNYKSNDVYKLNGFDASGQNAKCYWIKDHVNQFFVPYDSTTFSNTFDPEGFRMLNDLRNHLINKGRFTEQQLKICLC